MTKNVSHSLSESSLQIPSKSSARTLRPASPARTQPGFVVTPSDSRAALNRPESPEVGSPGPLAHRAASPRPPATKSKQKHLRVPSGATSKVKQADKGKKRSSTGKHVRSPSPQPSTPKAKQTKTIALSTSTSQRSNAIRSPSQHSISTSSGIGSPKSGTKAIDSAYEVPDAMDISQDSDIEFISANHEPGYNATRSADVKDLLTYFHVLW